MTARVAGDGRPDDPGTRRVDANRSRDSSSIAVRSGSPRRSSAGGDGGGYVGFDQYDVVTQEFSSTHVTVTPDGTGRFRRIPFRYAWPAEMDLMARIAGMRLRHRWADWDRSELTAESTKHVSVWAKRESGVQS